MSLASMQLQKMLTKKENTKRREKSADAIADSKKTIGKNRSNKVQNYLSTRVDNNPPEDTLQEIKALIICQEIKNKQRSLLARADDLEHITKVNSELVAHHKQINETQFRRKQYQSLATEIYNKNAKKALKSINLIENSLKTKENEHPNSENYLDPNARDFLTRNPNRTNKDRLDKNVFFRKGPEMKLVEQDYRKPQESGTIVGQKLSATQRQKDIGLLPSAMPLKKSFAQQTWSSQARQNRSFDAIQNTNKNQGAFESMVRSKKNPDITLAEIFHMGKKLGQEDLKDFKTLYQESKQKSQSLGTFTSALRRKIQIQEQIEKSSVSSQSLKENSVPMIIDQRTHEIGEAYDQVSVRSGKQPSTKGLIRHILKEQEANVNKSRQVTAPAFITQTQGTKIQVRNSQKALNSNNSMCCEPAIISGPTLGAAPAVVDWKFSDFNQDRFLSNSWQKVFNARQKDLQLSKNIEIQLQRFILQVQDMPHNKIILREMGFGKASAKALAKIIKDEEIVSVDLSQNTLNLGLDALVKGIVQNSSIISVKLSNNSIDGRRNQQELFNLIFQHPSLVSVDLGNTVAVKNRNRIHNEGFAAIIEAICQSGQFTLIQELHLAYSSITCEGLSSIGRIQQSGVQMSLQILDLSNNDLGSEAINHIAPFIQTLISLNLSGTKLGVKGALLLSSKLKNAYELNNKQHILRHLDLSNNVITSVGFQKLLSRLKKSNSLAYLNVSGNDFLEAQDKLLSLQKFLARNESCTQLLLNRCALKDQTFHYLGQGLSANGTLERLCLQDNDIITRDGLQFLVKGILDNKKHCKLVDLDLSKCKLMSKTIQPLCKLLASRYKLRTLNLKNNNIQDEGARELLENLVFNEYVTKISLEMNPVCFSIIKCMEAHTKANLQKVNEQEIPSMIQEIIDVKKQTAQALFDCAMDPLINDKVAKITQSDRFDRLRRVSSRGGSLYGVRSNKDRMKVEEQMGLLKGAYFRSNDVILVTDQIKEQLIAMQLEKEEIFKVFSEKEHIQSEMMKEAADKWHDLQAKKESAYARNRELDFVIKQIEGQTITRNRKHLQEIEMMENRIDKCKKAQIKLQNEINEVYKQQGVKNYDNQANIDYYTKELNQQQKEQNLALIILNSYTNEIDRMKRVIAKLEKEESEYLRTQENENDDQSSKFKLLTGSSAQKSEHRKNQKNVLCGKPKKKNNFKSKVAGSDCMGMNSPKKQQAQQRQRSERAVLAHSNLNKRNQVVCRDASNRAIQTFKRTGSERTKPLLNKCTTVPSTKATTKNNLGATTSFPITSTATVLRKGQEASQEQNPAIMVQNPNPISLNPSSSVLVVDSRTDSATQQRHDTATELGMSVGGGDVVKLGLTRAQEEEEEDGGGVMMSHEIEETSCTNLHGTLAADAAILRVKRNQTYQRCERGIENNLLSRNSIDDIAVNINFDPTSSRDITRVLSYNPDSSLPSIKEVSKNGGTGQDDSGINETTKASANLCSISGNTSFKTTKMTAHNNQRAVVSSYRQQTNQGGTQKNNTIDDGMQVFQGIEEISQHEDKSHTFGEEKSDSDNSYNGMVGSQDNWISDFPQPKIAHPTNISTLVKATQCVKSNQVVVKQKGGKAHSSMLK